MRLGSVCLAAVVVLLLAGCSAVGGASTAPSTGGAGTTGSAAAASQEGTAVPAGTAPAAAQVDAATLQLIPEWKDLQIPQYPGAKRTDWKPQATTKLPNAGTMLFQASEAPEQVLSFYRGALPQAGWKEIHAGGQEVAAQRGGTATLTVVVTRKTDLTLIMLILTD